MYICFNHYFVGSFTFYTIQVIRPVYFILWCSFKRSIHLLTHVSATLFASPNRQVQTWGVKVQWKVPEWRKNICLTTHTTECFLGICYVYRWYPTHICSLWLSENQIWFYKEVTKTKILFYQVLTDFSPPPKKRIGQALEIVNCHTSCM